VNQLPLDWTAPPFQGRTIASRHASWTGAQAVRETWTARQSAYLQLLNQAGSLNDFEAAALLKCNVSSVNSVRNAIVKAAEREGKPEPFKTDGFDEHRFVDFTGVERVARRTRWKIKR